MKYQRFVSLSAGLSFITLFLSSAILYFLPDRKISSWSGWKFLGLDKQQWDNLHINLGIFFLVMMVWHIYFNWKAIKNYLKVKRKLKIFTKEFNIALAWVTVFMIGTILMIPPLSIFINLGNGIKAINAHSMGTPPFGYAEEATLKDFCRLTKINPKSAIATLKKYNIKVSNDNESLKDISKNNNTTPQELYRLIYNPKFKLSLPPEIPIGIAKKTFLELTQIYQIDKERLSQYLLEYGIEIDFNKHFKEIAHHYNLHPAKLYAMVLASQIHN
jgi:hypothetical protein